MGCTINRYGLFGCPPRGFCGCKKAVIHESARANPSCFSIAYLGSRPLVFVFNPLHAPSPHLSTHFNLLLTNVLGNHATSRLKGLCLGWSYAQKLDKGKHGVTHRHVHPAGAVRPSHFRTWTWGKHRHIYTGILAMTIWSAHWPVYYTH